MMMPFNFQKWIDENRHLLIPPVGNKCVWEDREFIVMVVGGPNSRNDFHVNSGEEFFYQLEGDMNLRLFVDGHPQDVAIAAGDIFLLPARVPHSPHRSANSIGLVIEHKRKEGLPDAVFWICEKCHSKLYEEEFILTDITAQFRKILERYQADDAYRTCRHCGHENPRVGR